MECLHTLGQCRQPTCAVHSGTGKPDWAHHSVMKPQDCAARPSEYQQPTRASTFSAESVCSFNSRFDLCTCGAIEQSHSHASYFDLYIRIRDLVLDFRRLLSESSDRAHWANLPTRSNHKLSRRKTSDSGQKLGTAADLMHGVLKEYNGN